MCWFAVAAIPTPRHRPAVTQQGWHAHQFSSTCRSSCCSQPAPAGADSEAAHNKGLKGKISHYFWRLMHANIACITTALNCSVLLCLGFTIMNHILLPAQPACDCHRLLSDHFQELLAMPSVECVHHLALMLHTNTCRCTCSLIPVDTAEAVSNVLASLTAAVLCSWLVSTWTALCEFAWRSMAMSALKWTWKSCSQGAGSWWTRSWASLARAPMPM